MLRSAVLVSTLALAALLAACAPDDQPEVQRIDEMRAPAPVMPEDTLPPDTIMPPDTLPEGVAQNEP